MNREGEREREGYRASVLLGGNRGSGGACAAWGSAPGRPQGSPRADEEKKREESASCTRGPSAAVGVLISILSCSQGWSSSNFAQTVAAGSTPCTGLICSVHAFCRFSIIFWALSHLAGKLVAQDTLGESSSPQF